MKCRPGKQNSVCNGILPPSNKGSGNPSRTGTGPQCPYDADTTGYRQSWDKAWAMWVKYGQKDKTFRTVSGKGRLGISLTSFNKSRKPSPPPTPWHRCPWNIGRGTAIPFKMNETKWTSVLNMKEHLAFRMVLGKRRERQGISLEKCPASPFCHAASSTKSKDSRPRGPVGQATVDYLTWQGNTVQNEQEWVRSLLKHLSI